MILFYHYSSLIVWAVKWSPLKRFLYLQNRSIKQIFVFYRHCVSTISPPGASFPPDVELPHVPSPPGETGLPPGEGCYECNVNLDGIPLKKPLNLRQKRAVETDTTNHIHNKVAYSIDLDNFMFSVENIHKKSMLIAN